MLVVQDPRPRGIYWKYLRCTSTSAKTRTSWTMIFTTWQNATTNGIRYRLKDLNRNLCQHWFGKVGPSASIYSTVMTCCSWKDLILRFQQTCFFPHFLRNIHVNHGVSNYSHKEWWVGVRMCYEGTRYYIDVCFRYNMFLWMSHPASHSFGFIPHHFPWQGKTKNTMDIQKLGWWSGVEKGCVSKNDRKKRPNLTPKSRGCLWSRMLAPQKCEVWPKRWRFCIRNCDRQLWFKITRVKIILTWPFLQECWGLQLVSSIFHFHDCWMPTLLG